MMCCSTLMLILDLIPYSVFKVKDTFDEELDNFGGQNAYGIIIGSDPAKDQKSQPKSKNKKKNKSPSKKNVK